ncbi:surface antigen (D15) [Pseudopedobacter saltans DSM 12145]|uniref:Surface antigen (D15) n=2 Tax=Pseudopedobacter saltans TaxID=151895 RepID=F0SEN8_PSESL|nr:surface antigen (D15) [Pseudopedobacter saltans DSM 12145]
MGACRSTNRLKENESLITKLEINGIENTFSDQAYSYVSLDIRPNAPLNLWIYNTFNPNGRKTLGEAPRILDSSLVEVSRLQLEKFLKTKGFLNAKVNSDIKIHKKRAKVIFNAQQNEKFDFRNITFDIKDSSIKDLYLSKRKIFTHIREGKRFDEDSIAYERDQIYLLMKKNGYYEFVRPYVRAKIDTNLNSHQADVEIQILNPGDSTHQKYYLDNTYLRIQPTNANLANVKPDTLRVDSQYKFFDYSKFFKPEKLTNYIFLSHGNEYNISDVELTTQRLFDLNVFKSITVDFTKKKDQLNTLVGLVDMIPLKKKSNRIDGEYTFNSSITGVNAGFTYQNKNTFGGAEVFEVKFRGGFQFDKNLSGNLNDRLLSSDYQIGASLNFPRLITPFNIPSNSKNAVPRTRIAVNYQIYNLRESYLRRVLGTTLTYDWAETKYKSHSITPVSIQYVQGRISRDLQEYLESQGNSFFLATLRSQLVASSSYTYTYNLSRLTSLSNFTFFNGTLEVGGNTAALVSNVIAKNRNDLGNTILGVPYYQFVRLEGDMRFYKGFGGERQLVTRINPGVGYYYGNMPSLPFDKQFFAGGSSGIRAWQARTLGPGNYNRSSLESDSVRLRLRNLDQLGDIKFEGNVEYRFKILNDFFGSKVKGATFVDFGNIWRLKDNPDFPGSQFQFKRLWSQMAIGTGFGLRFDVSFFVFRLDAGLKLKDPQFSGSDQWIGKYYFDRQAKRAFKNRYAITNNPDRYSTTQIQFGIGMPF